MIYVIGAGIGGLSFAISFAQQQRTVRPPGSPIGLAVLEQEADESFHCSEKFVQSLSIRSGFGGLEALHQLGVLQAVRRRHSAATGDFVARSTTEGLSMVWDSAWAGSRPSAGSVDDTSTPVRVSRRDLWRALYDRTRERGVPVRFGCRVQEIDGPGGRISLVDGSVLSDAELSVVAAGAWSNVCPTAPLRALSHVMLGGLATVKSVWPDGVRNQHGLLFTDDGDCMMFVSHEAERRVSIGIAFPVADPIDRSDKRQLAQVHQRAIALAQANLPAALAELLVVQCLSLPGGAPLLVNCRHRRDVLQYDPSEQILRLGDAWHAVSPYAGAGANMALVDGCKLGRVVMAPSDCAKEAAELTRRWNAVFKREATVIGFAHSRDRLGWAWRCSLLRVVPLFADPRKRWPTLAGGGVALMVGAWACGLLHA